MALQLEGTVAVVTGGGSGIGAATAAFLERCGATVHRVDLSGPAPVDVTSREQLDAFAATLDTLDVLVNAAGILTPNADVAEAPLSDFERALDVNVLGTVNACQALGALLRADGGGAIVNVASQASTVALPSQAAYDQQGRGRRLHARARGRLGAPAGARQRGRAGLHADAADRRLLR